MRRLHVLLLLVGFLVACDSGDSGSATPDPKPDTAQMLHDAATVVVADVVDAGSAGEVTIRPTVSLRGALTVDANGLYRFASPGVADTRSGIWLFSDDGRPLSTPSGSSAGFPWPGDPDIVSTFPAPTLKEVSRVLGSADLVVEVSKPVNSFAHGENSIPVIVEHVLKGDGSVEAGDEITITVLAANFVGFTLPTMLFALERVDGAWFTIPSWVSLPWDCVNLPAQAIADEFSGFAGC